MGHDVNAPLAVDGAVSADTPEATLAGLDVLARGGNAVDAAVAVSLVLGVTEPSESGLGGSAVMLVLPAGKDAVVIDSDPAAAPQDSSTLAMPSALRVLHHAWSRYGSGKLSWEELVEPAVRVASDGYTLGRFAHHTIVRRYDRIIADDAATQQLLNPDHSIPSEGSRVANPELAKVLERVASEGADAFYVGEIAQRLVSSMPGRTGNEPFPSPPAVRESAAMKDEYRTRVVWSAPAPYGGPLVREALRFLTLAPTAWTRDAGWARTAWLAESLAFAWEEGAVHPVEQITLLAPMPAPGSAAASKPEPSDGLASTPPDSSSSRHGKPKPLPQVRQRTSVTRGAPRDGSGASSDFTVVDGAGNAVSVSQTLGAPFGSGLALGLGFFHQLRRPMDDGWLPVPTIVTADGGVQLALGSPGGERGVAAVTQVLLRFVDLEEPVEDAVSAKRLYVSRPGAKDRGRLFLEGVVWEDSLSVRHAAYGSWGDSVEVQARTRGFSMGEERRGPVLEGLDPWFGGVNAVAWKGGVLTAVGDPRRKAVGGTLNKGAPTLERTDASVMKPPAPEG
jgi:gamma-glutamyltranspeptidase/glutathione hydrolase